MQDRFKFRVWHKPWGELEQPEMLYNAESAYDYMGEVPASSFGSVLNDESFKVMQCTGLKDKNGKLIYEGDICRNTKTDEIVSVAWHGTFASFVWSKPKYAKIYDFGELFRAYDYYEVIGNIYENPELLESN